NTVDLADTYDGQNQEPVVLPARFPNLLVNGGGGIAVGMATNIPPHNLNEVIDACIHVLDNPDAKPNDLMRFVKGPDFPTGALILGRDGIRDAYRTGRGSIKTRAVTDIEEGRRGEGRIVVTEVPYQTSVEVIGQKIAELVNERMIDAITELIRAEADVDAARTGLMEKPFEFSEIQANFILDMQLRRLTQLEGQKLRDELGELREQIKELESILRSKKKLRTVIKD